MLQIQVETDPNITVCGKIKDILDSVPAEKEKWEALLANAEIDGTEELILSSYAVSDTPSENFQVLGVFYRTLHIFLKQHTYPKTVRILCPDRASAKMYRQIYNFYIPATKADRMPDDDWD